jgi:hypothetical protein
LFETSQAQFVLRFISRIVISRELFPGTFRHRRFSKPPMVIRGKEATTKAFRSAWGLKFQGRGRSPKPETFETKPRKYAKWNGLWHDGTASASCSKLLKVGSIT